MSPPRRVALEIFREWEASRASAEVLLDRHLARLPGRDRDLAAEIVRGVLRWLGRLDWQLAALVDRPLDALDSSVRWILRLGLYQLEHLDRVPPHAAVATSVELAKRSAARGAGALVNAVLRRAPERLLELAEPDAATDPAGHLEVRTSHPRWLLERWLSRYGFPRTLALAAANNRRPSLTLRVASGRVTPEDVIAVLRSRGIEAEPGQFLPGCVRLPGGWAPPVRELLQGGLVVVQGEAAGLVAHVARPSRGGSILDVCSAPGGKAIHLAQLAGDARVIAGDISARRLARVREAADRLGLRHVRAVVADGLRPATRGGFSRVLVDAPCSNTGVLAKRPDARWRRQPEDLPRLAELQGRLLDAAREQVGAGGLLVYSTCSLEPEENEDVIRAYFDRHRRDTIVPADGVVPAELVRDGLFQADPVTNGTEGAFAAAIRPSGAASRTAA